jgi:hypothetical protein
VLIGRDFMVRGHGERCKAPEPLFASFSHYQAVLGARSSSPSHLFARNVEEQIMSEVSLYGHSPRAELGCGRSCPRSAKMAADVCLRVRGANNPKLRTACWPRSRICCAQRSMNSSGEHQT